MKEKQAKKWEEMRALGQKKYIIKVGIMQWGLIMCGIFVGMQTAQRPNAFLSILFLNVVVWAFAGLCFGYFTWIFSEKSYKKYLQDNK